MTSGARVIPTSRLTRYNQRQYSSSNHFSTNQIATATMMARNNVSPLPRMNPVTASQAVVCQVAPSTFNPSSLKREISSARNASSLRISQSLIMRPKRSDTSGGIARSLNMRSVSSALLISYSCFSYLSISLRNASIWRGFAVSSFNVETMGLLICSSSSFQLIFCSGRSARTD